MSGQQKNLSITSGMMKNMTPKAAPIPVADAKTWQKKTAERPLGMMRRTGKRVLISINCEFVRVARQSAIPCPYVNARAL